MAMTVMAIGGAAVMTMQKTSVKGNLDARRTDVANSIARTWVERLQRDADAVDRPRAAEHRQQHRQAQSSARNERPGNWFLPDGMLGHDVPETMSPGFDILGRDLPQAQLASADFCVNVRLTWLDTTALPPSRRPHPRRRPRPLAEGDHQRAPGLLQRGDGGARRPEHQHAGCEPERGPEHARFLTPST